MTRVLEINYWKVAQGAEQDTGELVRKFAKFAFKSFVVDGNTVAMVNNFTSTVPQ